MAGNAQDDMERWLGDASLPERLAQFDEEGFIVFERILTPDDVARLRAAIEPHFLERGRNDFEGLLSNRVYALLAKAPEAFAPLVTHPLALTFAEATLGASCLLSALLAINLLPGETSQAWHHDDEHITALRGDQSYGVSAFWTIDAMTAENGATQVIPGSHRWKERPQAAVLESAAQSVILPAGSLMIIKGGLLHRGGANRSSAPRLIVTPQYCPGWARQLENMVLATPADVAARLPQRVRELIGYSIHEPFMGYVDGVHPARVIGHRR